MQGNEIEMTEVIACCLFCAWLAVALVLFGRRIAVYHGFVRYIRAGTPRLRHVDRGSGIVKRKVRCDYEI